MKVLFYVAEMQSPEKTIEKKDILEIWAKVNGVQVVGIVNELNAENRLGSSGQGAINDILKQYEVDAVVVASVKDLTTVQTDACTYIKSIRQMGVDVISLEGDVPNCIDCKKKFLCSGKEAYKRDYHCTVEVFHE